jgi:DNA-binding NarL/FixJ family response regulator
MKDVLAKGLGSIEWGEAADAQQTLDLVQKQSWNVLVLDISLPGRSGLDVLPDIKAAQPDLPVLILSMHGEEQFALRVLKAGAAGFVNKGSAPSELVNAVQKIIEGGCYIGASLAQKLVSHLLNNSEKPSHEQLSDREFEIMRLIANGHGREQIARSIHLSVKTVSTYRARLMEKMKFKSNAEITRYAIKNNLVS